MRVVLPCDERDCQYIQASGGDISGQMKRIGKNAELILLFALKFLLGLPKWEG